MVGRLQAVREEISKARTDLVTLRERLVAERADLDEQLITLEHELRVLEQLGDASSRAEAPPARLQVSLSRRIIESLERNGSELTSRQMRETLRLDRREVRNLGPVLNQLAKTGKIASGGRGEPWRLKA